MSNEFGEVFAWDGSDAPRVLWLSRHEMSDEQKDDIAHIIGGAELVTMNVTYPAHSDDAVAEITALARARNCRWVCGVFPAHIAAAFARRQGWQALRVLVPVSIPVAAVEGQARGFTHSHWEEC
jgi:hypothetical protein